MTRMTLPLLVVAVLLTGVAAAANDDAAVTDYEEEFKAHIRAAQAHLTSTPANNRGALGNLKEAVAILETAVNAGQLDPTKGVRDMDRLTAIAGQIVSDAMGKTVSQAVGRSEDEGGEHNLVARKTDEARQDMVEGDRLRAWGKFDASFFKDAIDQYKKALNTLNPVANKGTKKPPK